MTVSTEGLAIRTGSRPLRALVEMLSSMRFSISLLTVICIASVIGTVLKQGEPLGNYVNQFGPFWAQVFALARLNTVYSAWWFLLILTFLVISTSLCIARNTPKILADLRTYKEGMRAQSLRAFHLRAEGSLAEDTEGAARRLGQLLASGGWKVKLQQREGQGWMLAAKKGAANKLGYLAAHSAIVLVCLGGLLDGDMIVRAQMWLQGKSVFTGGGTIADVAPKYRLSDSTPTFRANLLVAEGTQSSTAVINQSDGIVLQELPFSVELKKFIVEYYSTGMPKLFASDIVIHDLASGETKEARVEVNHPASYKGVEIYQSSFDDGGSAVKLKAVPMNPTGKAFSIEGTIGGNSQLANGDEKMTLEYSGLRVINVENFAGSASGGDAVDVRKVDLQQSIGSHLGAANKTSTRKDLRNVGPSVSYKLRDAAGQAREYNNYMLPVDTGDGVPVFLLGVRDTLADSFRYMRIPADDTGSMQGFMQLRAALLDAPSRETAVRRYVAKVVDTSKPELVQQLTGSAARVLALFAGAETVKGSRANGGLQSVSDFLEANVPESERGKAGEVLIRILNGTLFELAQLAREQAGQPAWVPGDKAQAWMTQAVLALSDAFVYPAPMVFQLESFNQVQASVFQVARAPGKNVVYLGCALLILGVFAMLYVRERRLWVWLAPVDGQPGHSSAHMALSSNRKTMDADHEFEQLRAKLLPSAGVK
jgi:cytochrome c biogenesis protein